MLATAFGHALPALGSTDTLDQKFAALETESEVDRQLRELKARRQQSQLPSGGA